MVSISLPPRTVGRNELGRIGESVASQPVSKSQRPPAEVPDSHRHRLDGDSSHLAFDGTVVLACSLFQETDQGVFEIPDEDLCHLCSSCYHYASGRGESPSRQSGDPGRGVAGLEAVGEEAAAVAQAAEVG